MCTHDANTDPAVTWNLESATVFVGQVMEKMLDMAVAVQGLRCLQSSGTVPRGAEISITTADSD